MLITAIILHHPDTTIFKCHGDIDQIFDCSCDALAGKTLHAAGVCFFDNTEEELLAGDHPLQHIKDTRQAINNISLGILSHEKDSPLRVTMDGYPELDSTGDVVRIVTVYSTNSSTDCSTTTESTKPQKRIEQDWSRTFDAIADVVTILTPDLYILRANAAAYSIFQLSQQQLLGRKCHEVFQGTGKACEMCPLLEHDSSIAPGSGKVLNERLGKTFEVQCSPVLDDNGSLQHFVHTARDITKKIEDDREKAILSAAFEQTSDSIVITTVDGIIRYVNSSSKTSTGYSEEELIGRNIRSFIINSDATALFDTIWATMLQGKPWHGHLKWQKSNGATLIGDSSVSPIVAKNGKVTNLVTVKRDITKEEELQRQLQQAMKLEAIGTLAGGIAHDFNNILAAIIGYGQIVKTKLNDQNSLCSDIDHILQAGDRAAKLVKQILTFSRQEGDGTVFHPLEVQFIIKEVIKLLRSSLPTTITIHQDIQSSCPPILADPTQLHQVLMNLCTNAKHAIGDSHGCISISLQEHKVKETQLLQETSLLTQGNYVHLSITDNGRGMSKETQDRIFDPFFTTKPKEQGTGLGLSVVHGIVESHEGVITVDSIEKDGTTFDLYFPAIEKTRPVQSRERYLLPRGDERIMVVDDEEPLAKMLELVLQGLGYRVMLFTDSLAAVVQYRQRPRDFDAIITDMTMPHMTGTELAREMLSIRPELPIILTTGYSETIDEEKASRLGLRRFMLKPVKKAELAQTLREVLDNA